MEWLETIRLWNQTPIRVWDIRHVVLKPWAELRSYRLPANTFLVSSQGEARIQLDGMNLSSEGCQVFHCGQGSVLNLWGLNRPFEYYLILYKPMLRLKSDVLLVQEEHQASFKRQYSFRASEPIALLSLLERMHHYWTNGKELERLQVTGLFYQFAYEQFRQLQLEGAELAEPDLAMQIAQYLHEHYQQSIPMETMANVFHYSTHYLARVFKRKFGNSPMEYQVQLRMDKAKALMIETDIPIRTIAESVGYTDIYYFNRLFKKQTGATPAQFKMYRPGPKGSIRTNFMPESFIAPQAGESYSVNSDNHYQHNAWRVDEMNLRFKPSFAVTLLFSLSLLLAACGGAGAEVQPTAQASNEQKNESANTVSSEKRMYKDALGREIEIPADPTKVVVVTYGGYLLPLGLKPVGVDQATLEHYPEDMVDVVSIGSGLGNAEAISALEPDLIIVPDYHNPESYASYEKIAPTIAVAWGGDPNVIDTLRTMGDIMNRKDEAEAWVAKFEEKLQRIRDQIDINIKEGTTAITFILYEGEFLLGGEGGTLGKLIYEDYGFKMPEQFKQFADGGTSLSMEQFVNQPADYFFTQMTDEEMAKMTELFQEPIYQAIPAIKENRIINVTRDKWNYGPYLVDEAVDALIEQVAKVHK
ncbi:ABC transporter substrate-binding protein [Paenibacillus sinopodophylli]|uniref:ABC transporter substrate-binding protein n=1 Tax=Paenibacillus sinopodophylli TaxID=1837342 RepID=UPI00110D078D|nr:ABC transporter substrate-binding protein [Paenibacillus sinopodophylli]